MIAFTAVVILASQITLSGSNNDARHRVLNAPTVELIGANGVYGDYRFRFETAAEFSNGEFFAELKGDASFRPPVSKRIVRAVASAVGLIIGRSLDDVLDRILGSSDRQIVRIPPRHLSRDDRLYTVRKLVIRHTGTTATIRIVWADPRRDEAYAATEWISLTGDVSTAETTTDSSPANPRGL